MAHLFQRLDPAFREPGLGTGDLAQLPVQLLAIRLHRLPQCLQGFGFFLPHHLCIHLAVERVHPGHEAEQFIDLALDGFLSRCRDLSGFLDQPVQNAELLVAFFLDPRDLQLGLLLDLLDRRRLVEMRRGQLLSQPAKFLDLLSQPGRLASIAAQQFRSTNAARSSRPYSAHERVLSLCS